MRQPTPSERAQAKQVKIAEEIDALCDEFDSQWMAGNRPALEDFMDRRKSANVESLLGELLKIEIEYRQFANENLRADDFALRFPKHANVVDGAFQGFALQAGQKIRSQDETCSLNVTAPPKTVIQETDGFVAGPYRAYKLHAKGGLGEVYRAHDHSLNREVAVKRIQAPFLSQADVWHRFELEAEITGRLEHPGVVPIYAFGIDDSGQPYYAMRFIDGETLENASARLHKIRRKTSPGVESLQFRKLLLSFLAASQAVAFAHSRGVVHRDIKPANIMLGDYGETLVVDWGLAKPISTAAEEVSKNGQNSIFSLESAYAVDKTVQGSAKGSPTYMSPEQACGDMENVGIGSDVYSLGATLYHLLAGRGPVRGDSLPEILENVRQGRFPKPSELNGNCPKALEAVCLKAMSLDPGNRYDSATELAEDVSRWLADEPVSAWTEPWTIRTRRWMGRRRAFMATVTAVPLTMLVALGVLSWNQHRWNNELETVASNLRVQRDKKEANLYVSHINVAKQSLDHRRFRGTVDLLRRHLPQPGQEDRRGFEWYFLWNCSHRDTLLYGQNHHTVRALRYSPDGRHLVIVGFFNDVILRDLQTGRNRFLSGHTSGVSSVDFSPDGRYLVTGSHDQTVIIWNVSTGRIVEMLKKHTRVVTTVCFSPRPGSHQLISAGDDKQILLWDAKDKAWGSFNGTREPTRIVGTHKNNIHGADFSPDGKYIVSVSKDGAVKIWSALTTSTGPTVPLKSINLNQEIFPVRFCRGSQAVVFGAKKGRLYIWEWNSKDQPRLLGRKDQDQPHHDLIYGLAYDGRREMLASADRNGRVAIWDMRDERVVMQQKLHAGIVHCLGFSRSADPDDLSLATGGGEVQIWNVADLQSPTRKDRVPFATVLPASPPGNVAAESPSGLWAIAISKQNRLIAVAGDNGRISIWQAGEHSQQYEFKRIKTLQLDVASGLRVYAVAFSADGRYLAAGGGDRMAPDRPGIVSVWHIHSSGGKRPTFSKALNWKAHDRAVNSVDFSSGPERLLLATSSHDDTAAVWNLNALHARSQAPVAVRQFLVDKHEHYVWQARFSPDGKTLATTGHDGFTFLWNVATGKLKRSKLHRRKTGIGSREMVFSNSGRYLAIAAGGKRLEVWDLQKDEKTLTVECQTSYITGVSISADEKTVAITSDRRTVELWSLKTGEELFSLRGINSEINDVAFAFEDEMLFAVTGKGKILIWHAPRQLQEMPATRSE